MIDMSPKSAMPKNTFLTAILLHESELCFILVVYLHGRSASSLDATFMILSLSRGGTISSSPPVSTNR